jgi:hypothetical protein
MGRSDFLLFLRCVEHTIATTSLTQLAAHTCAARGTPWTARTFDGTAHHGFHASEATTLLTPGRLVESERLCSTRAVMISLVLTIVLFDPTPVEEPLVP